MTFINSSGLPEKENDVGQEETLQLHQWLSNGFYQRILPLELYYLDLLHQQITLLKRYCSSTDLTGEQSEELTDWIDQSQRVISSHAFIEQATATSPDNKTVFKADLETSLWRLFGAGNKEEIAHNINVFCIECEQKITALKTVLAEITSLNVLNDYLKRRQKRDKRTARFVEEVHHDHLHLRS